MATELEVHEYVLGLDALTVGLGGEAFRIFQRAQARDVVPLVAKQKAALALMEKERRAGLPVTDRDAVVLAQNAELEAAWERCLEQLKTLWFTSPHAVVPEEVVP